MTDYYPNPVDAQRVQKFKRAGVLNQRIAEILRIRLEDLEKHYPVELGFTDEEDLAEIANVAYRMAVSGEDSSMTKWWLSVKGGWNPNVAPQGPETQPLMIILADGAQIQGEVIEDAEFVEVPSGSHLDQDQAFNQT